MTDTHKLPVETHQPTILRASTFARLFGVGLTGPVLSLLSAEKEHLRAPTDCVQERRVRSGCYGFSFPPHCAHNSVHTHVHTSAITRPSLFFQFGCFHVYLYSYKFLYSDLDCNHTSFCLSNFIRVTFILF